MTAVKALERSKPLAAVLRALRVAVLKVPVCGVPGITRAVINRTSSGQCELLCEGAAFGRVMGVPGVLASKTTCNHVVEVCRALGVEAARMSIQSEVRKVMDAYGIAIDARHLMLLADLMTYKGEVLGINRFGVAKMKDSVLMLASFEKTTDHLFGAALHGKVDDIVGVSESIIMGIPMTIGTGAFKVLTRARTTHFAPRKSLFVAPHAEKHVSFL